MQKVIIDTDPGVDDALALMMALKNPGFEVLGITTVAGNATIENVTRNARYVLDFLGRNELPIFSGSNRPLNRNLKLATVHGDDGFLGLNPLANVELNNGAERFIIDSVKNNPGELVIIALGPLTNIARAIQADPEAMLQVKRLIVMGGAVEVPGNMGEGAEFNFYVDPEAAKIVCDFPITKSLVPLDVCNQAILSMDDVSQITNPKMRDFVANIIQPYAVNILEDTGIDGAIVYDALAVYYAIDPDVFEKTQRSLSVDISDKGRGAVIDALPASSDITVAIGFTQSASFAQRLIQLVND